MKPLTLRVFVSCTLNLVHCDVCHNLLSKDIEGHKVKCCKHIYKCFINPVTEAAHNTFKRSRLLLRMEYGTFQKCYPFFSIN